MEKIIARIAQYRNKIGFTYENMADELNITPAAYRKIEIGSTKLTVERLYKLAEILDTSVAELLDIEVKEVYTQENKEGSSGYLQKIAHFHQENKESYESHIQTLKDEISFLKNLIELK